MVRGFFTSSVLGGRDSAQSTGLQEKVDNHRQVSPAHSCPDIGSISGPSLIGLLYIELRIKTVRDVQVWLIRLLVGVPWRPRADQP